MDELNLTIFHLTNILTRTSTIIEDITLFPFHLSIRVLVLGRKFFYQRCCLFHREYLQEFLKYI